MRGEEPRAKQSETTNRKRRSQANDAPNLRRAGDVIEISHLPRSRQGARKTKKKSPEEEQKTRRASTVEAAKHPIYQHEFQEGERP